MRLFINSLIGLLTLLYPFAVYVGINYFEPWKIAVMLIVLLGIKLAASYFERHWSMPLLVAGMLYCGFAIWRNDLVTLRYYPALINAMSLLVFSWSLLSPPSLVERLARIQHPDLPPEGVVYTLRVTQVWCGFFIINGGIALATALWSSVEVWSLYNGFITYLLMGALFAGEYVVRMRTQKHVR